MRRFFAILLITVTLCICLVGCHSVEETPISTEVPEESLAYYLMHRDTGKLLSVSDDALVMESEPIQNVLWLFLPCDDGGYVAKNEVSGRYLAFAEDGKASLTDAWERAISWQWQRMSDHTYRLAMHSDEGKLLSVADGEARLDENDDRWEIRPLTLQLNVYYDEAFEQTYEKKGTYVMDALEKILLENTTGDADFRSVTEVFRKELHIRLALNITDTPYESYPYRAGCLYRDDPLTPCHNCLGEEVEGYGELEYCKNGYHHKDGDHIIQSTPQSDETFNIIFTGHSASCACDEQGKGQEVHVDDKSGIYGRAEGLGKGNRVAVFLGAFNDAEDYGRIKFTVAHELMHLLDARHHRMQERCLHALTEMTDAPLWDFAEDHLLLPLCDSCIARMNACKAAVLYRHENN